MRGTEVVCGAMVIGLVCDDGVGARARACSGEACMFYIGVL